MSKNIKDFVSTYYSDKIKKHGATASGVDWNGEESQFLRFAQLSKIIEKEPFAILDYGCGYGAYLSYLKSTYRNFMYFGFDVSKEMIQAAQEQQASHKNAFSQSPDELHAADYVMASGIFNVRNKISDKDWLNYIQSELNEINRLAKNGFSFNALTSYSDEEHKRDYLYYADPLFLFDYCKQNFSRNVALLHDYELYEFTILVKK